MEIFERTSDKLYDKHQYKLKFSKGDFLILDDYQDVIDIWVSSPLGYCDIIEVLDKKEKKSTKTKGFI